MTRLFKRSHAPMNLDLGILIVRIAVSILMLTHGVPKLMKYMADEPIAFANVFGLGMGLSLALAVFAEVFCSILLIIGLATRPALIPLIITMLVAVIFVHGNDPFVVKEKAIIFLLTYIILFFTGSGKYSLDRMLTKKEVILSN
ncbi:MAG: DoxX family protein [Ginsengibacter sp.]